eukprot:Blabericola_migrator_1__7044@NODE_3572_length_1668_cov_752_118676_g2219_i0_p2_GENE_NODE_3572_length_1668_cov_752_118676_g2219_i0NODE_3572_length_1668_cov_752_118676_g2219_i0_p2_ORF_typecomplete_len116_score21_37_NODE_3572_length_1668_cov_752_118676_g2219_i085432
MRFSFPLIVIALSVFCVATVYESGHEAVDNGDLLIVDEAGGTGDSPQDDIHPEGWANYDGNRMAQSPQVEWTSNDEDGIVPLMAQRKPEADSDTLGKSRAELLAAAFPGVRIFRF